MRDDALEGAKADKEAHGEFESECPGYCGAQDTFYVGTLITFWWGCGAGTTARAANPPELNT